MTNEELKELVFTAIGAASMCWDPLPGNQVFESTRAKEIGDGLAQKLLPFLAQNEAMRVALADIAEGIDSISSARAAKALVAIATLSKLESTP